MTEPTPTEGPRPPEAGPSRSRPGPMVPLALAVYLPMVAVGLLAAPAGTFTVRDGDALAAGLLAALAGVAVVVAGSRWVSAHTAWGRALHAEFHALVAGLSPGRVALLALLSAAGEEFLFRGVLHPWLGLWITAALFAAMHFPMRPALRPWTAFAFVMGVALGLLVDASQSIWPPVLLHYGVNHLNLAELARPDEEARDGDGAGDEDPGAPSGPQA